MDISLRSVLTAGLATVTASAVALAPAIQPLPTPTPKIDIAASSQPWIPTASSTFLEDLASWTQNFVLPSANASFPTPIPNDAVQVTGINDTIKNVYNAVEPWVEWGFDIAAYVVGWIPWIGWLGPQISILYDFGEAIVRSFVFNGSDWLFGPLGFNQKVSNIIGDVWDASWQLLWDEIDWLIPGLPIPPLPPCPAILCSGSIGNAVVTASGWLRDGSLWIWDLWDEPIKGWIDSGVASANNIFDALNWVPFVPLIQFETNSIWGLAQGLKDPWVAFAQDMIRAGDQAVADFFNGGLITAAVNATEATWNSIVLHGGEAIDSVGVFVQEQWDYFTGGFLDQGLSTAVGEERVAATGGLATVVDDLRAALRGGVTAGTATLDSLTETSGIDQSQTQSDGVNDFGHRAGHRLIRGLVGRGDAGVAGRHALADLAGSRADVTLAKRTPGDKAEDATGGSDDRAKTSRWSTKLRLGHHRAVFGSDDVKKSDAPGASPDESRAASDESGKSSDKQRKSPLKRSSPWGKRFVGSGAGGDGKG